MKIKRLLFIATLFLTNYVQGEDCIDVPSICRKEGQYCKRWNGQVGWCRVLYDIKGNPSISCEELETDRFGYPDRGYFWPGRQRDTLYL